MTLSHVILGRIQGNVGLITKITMMLIILEFWHAIFILHVYILYSF